MLKGCVQPGALQAGTHNLMAGVQQCCLRPWEHLNCSHPQPDGGSNWELWPPVLRNAFGNETSAEMLGIYLFQSFWCAFNAALCFVMLSSAAVQRCGGVSCPCTSHVEPSLTPGMCPPGWLYMCELEGPQFLLRAQMLSWVPWHALPLLWITCLFYTMVKPPKHFFKSSRSGSSKLSQYHQIQS